MSIWGKLLAGTFGFALGGPIGALLGVIAGHSVDKIRRQNTNESIGIQSPQEIITIGIIILAAKLAKADGQVTSDEVKAFREKFKIPPNFQSDVGKIFNEAKKIQMIFINTRNNLGCYLEHNHKYLNKSSIFYFI